MKQYILCAVLPLLSFFLFCSQILADDSSHTTNLKRCVNEKIGFRIKCSKDWDIKPMPQVVFFVISKQPRVVVTIDKSKTSKTLDELNIPKINPFGKTSRSMVDGQEAIRTDIDTPWGDHMLDLYVIKDSYLYTINFTVNPGSQWKDYSPIFEEMISSFQFLEKS